MNASLEDWMILGLNASLIIVDIPLSLAGDTVTLPLVLAMNDGDEPPAEASPAGPDATAN